MSLPLPRLRPACLILSAALLAAMPAARAADFLATDTWPMAAAQQALADEIGAALVHDITIDADSIFITADHAADPEQTTDYSWDGVSVRQGISMPNFTAMGMGDTEPFPLADLPFDRLPAVKRAAIAAFALPEAQITEIEGTMPTTRTSKKLIPLWEVHFARSGGETGSVLLTANAQVLDVISPASQQVEAGPWLAPATVAATLARLGAEFGPNARYAEILIDDSKALVQMEDPRNPGQLVEIYVTADSIRRQDSMMMGMANPFGPTLDRAFTLSDIAALDPDRLADLEQRTIARMGMPGMSVFRYTISRSVLFMTPEDDRLVVEVRAELSDGWTGGRVAYDMAGNEVDVVTP
ncbi:hypothetical protein [Devosia ginsengisoli]|uniref:hypothetical protein n=1 Tax=Devosia ginsengisoli TaxID=400770 RepID=UPI0026E96295|nr:hypothetical protein [Devosia ginsengisoli]MCR6671949.1 hypothetical protein [Devosia ginsengisoli]